MTLSGYRKLNEGTIKNAYPLPLISELVDKLKGAMYFTKLDIQQCPHQGWRPMESHIQN